MSHQLLLEQRAAPSSNHGTYAFRTHKRGEERPHIVPTGKTVTGKRYWCVVHRFHSTDNWTYSGGYHDDVQSFNNKGHAQKWYDLLVGTGIGQA